MRGAALAAMLLAAAPALACDAGRDARAIPGTLAESPSAVARAWFEMPTDIYDHRVLGDRPDAATLAVLLDGCRVARVAAGAGHVFEDTAPRLADLDGDGRAEAVVVRTDVARGAQLAVYGAGPDGRLALRAATPPIGQRHRWLAPAAVADLDGDGAIELAYVDRPHLARVLRIWRYADGGLREVARLEGVTNHRIGEPKIAGGVRNCGGGPEIVLASADWSRRVVARLSGGAIVARDAGPWPGAAGALAC